MNNITRGSVKNFNRSGSSHLARPTRKTITISIDRPFSEEEHTLIRAV